MSTDIIYNCIYAQPIRQLKKDLILALRPLHIEGWLFHGYWERDMVKGAGNTSPVGTLVERTSPVVKLPQFKPSGPANVQQGFTDEWRRIAKPVTKRLQLKHE